MRSFLYALKGIRAAVAGGRNMRIHLAAAFYVVCGGLVSRVEGKDWPILVLCIALVLGMEALNTALEGLCDALHPEYSLKIGRVKDLAAGAVLLCAIGAAVAGGLIFFRQARFQAALETFRTYPILIAAAALSLPLAILFIIGRKKK